MVRRQRSSSSSSVPPRSSSPGPTSGPSSDDSDDRPSQRRRLDDVAAMLKKAMKDANNSEAVKEYRKIGKFIYRGRDLFVNVQLLFYIGRESDDDPVEEDLDEAQRAHLHKLYDDIVQAHPKLAEHLNAVQDNEDPTAYNFIIETIKAAAGDGRAEDTNHLKKNIHDFFFLDDKESFNPPLHSFTNKSRLGFKHRDIARALIPIEYLEDLITNEAETLEKILTGEIEVTGLEFPAFMYEKNSFDPQDIAVGLCRGHILLRCFRYIFTGPSSALNGPDGKKQRPNNAQIHGLKKVTPRTIAYVACQVRFSLSKAVIWSTRDDAFDYVIFYENILNLFENETGLLDAWAKDTLDWWNHHVFGTQQETARPPKLSASAKLLAQKSRSSATAAAAARAVTVTVLQDKDTNRSEPEPEETNQVSDLQDKDTNQLEPQS